MLLVVLIFAVFMMAVGSYGIAIPAGLVRFGRAFAGGPGVWGGFALRVVLAVALWFGADGSATPLVFRILALASVMGAISLPLMGQKGLERIVERVASMNSFVLRLICLTVLAAGVFLFWSARSG
ncbi:MAG: hypothetical protein OEU54_13730 [Gemmatimonadota bacterium]|nr:hypothetical protein [Gemmatimonadota bacterium]